MSWSHTPKISCCECRRIPVEDVPVTRVALRVQGWGWLSVHVAAAASPLRLSLSRLTWPVPLTKKSRAEWDGFQRAFSHSADFALVTTRVPVASSRNNEGMEYEFDIPCGTTIEISAGNLFGKVRSVFTVPLHQGGDSVAVHAPEVASAQINVILNLSTLIYKNIAIPCTKIVSPEREIHVPFHAISASLITSEASSKIVLINESSNANHKESTR